MSKVKSLKQYMAELDQIIAWFESDEFDLELALVKHQAAKAIVAKIEERLQQLKNQIIKI